MLDRDFTPARLRGLNRTEIPALCAEIREVILDSVSACGGHLASNLGIVETTVALHRVFDTPKDQIIFDVGHQCYAHKLLTGRREGFSSLRQFGGMSGFPRREESEYDPFTTGHSGASLSAAVGIAEANRLSGSDAWTVAVIGDGSFGNGMIYEALNACSRRGLRLIIVLNDNEMSISRNVGAISDYFAKIRLSRGYFTFKRAVKKICARIPLLGKPMIAASVRTKEFIKRALNQKNIFESLGLEYLGPMDGADEAALESVLAEAKDCGCPCVVHVITQKGRGYFPAEEKPEIYHGVSPFSLLQGIGETGKKETFSSAFGEEMCALAEENEKICAVTAAMRDGTGLAPFGERFPDRLFDAGIAEEHAVTFSAGLARAGMRPVTALYSTFAQRTFDQVLHDAALQKLPLTLALDRCGIVPGDGATHQGLFDVSLFRCIPGAKILAPESHGELREMLRGCVRAESGIHIFRYPRGAEENYDRTVWKKRDGGAETADFGVGLPACVIVSYGRESYQALLAADMLADGGMPVRVIRLTVIHPLPEEVLLKLIGDARLCVVAEEAMRRGGVGEAIAAMLAQWGKNIRTRILAAEDFVPHGDTDSLRRMLMLDAGSLADAVKNDMGAF